MRVGVTAQGVLIPRHMLPGVEEVEVRAEHGKVVVVPVAPVPDDPIVGLGSSPVDCGVEDASQNHDRYLYRTAE